MTSGIPLTSLQSFQILGTKREEKDFWNVILFDSKEKIQPTSLFNLHIYQPTHPLLFLPPSTSPAAATTPSWHCFSSLDEIEPLWCEHERLHCKMKETRIWPKAGRQSTNTSGTKYEKSSPTLKMTKKKRRPLFTSPLCVHCQVFTIVSLPWQATLKRGRLWRRFDRLCYPPCRKS